MVYFRGQKSLGHAQIGLLWGFNSQFLTSISPPLSYVESPLPPGWGLEDNKHIPQTCIPVHLFAFPAKFTI